LTQHLPYSLVIEKLSKHFGRTQEVSIPHQQFLSAANQVTQDDDTGPEMPLVLEAVPARVANDSSKDYP
jgi:hypothetical protein